MGLVMGYLSCLSCPITAAMNSLRNFRLLAKRRCASVRQQFARCPQRSTSSASIGNSWTAACPVPVDKSTRPLTSFGLPVALVTLLLLSSDESATEPNSNAVTVDVRMRKAGSSSDAESTEAVWADDASEIPDTDLPVYSRAQVAEHNSIEKGVWVVFEGRVYDVTHFVSLHPGGAKILLAAGSSVEPFWRLYAQHRKPYVLQLLRKYKIGRLDPVEAAALQKELASQATDPFALDPIRDAQLLVRSLKPFNAETPSDLLTASYLTPQDVLFTRNHLPVPKIDADTYSLSIDGEGLHSQLTLEHLQDTSRFKQHSVVSAIQCAGNRRGAMSRSKPSRGLDWGPGAIGNGEWGGVLLRDVLLSLGVSEADVVKGKYRHVRFEGLDRDPSGASPSSTSPASTAPSATSDTGYGASIPIDIAMDPRRQVMLAWSYNGEDLTPDHGYPLRVIVPGVVAARQVKWLGRISLSSDESETVWQRSDYKAFPPWQNWDNVDPESMPALQDMPVSSAITHPHEGYTVAIPASAAMQAALGNFSPSQLQPVPSSQLGRQAPPSSSSASPQLATVPVQGWAWSGGGRAITRVDLSTDNGCSWLPANITHRPHDTSPSLTQSFGWSLWEADVPIPPHLQRTLIERQMAAASVSSRLVLPKDGIPPSHQEPVTMSIAVKAIDSACNTQPESPLHIWNYRGISNNAWGKVNVKLELQ